MFSPSGLLVTGRGLKETDNLDEALNPSLSSVCCARDICSRAHILFSLSNNAVLWSNIQLLMLAQKNNHDLIMNA